MERHGYKKESRFIENRSIASIVVYKLRQIEVLAAYFNVPYRERLKNCENSNGMRGIMIQILPSSGERKEPRERFLLRNKQLK